MEELEEIAKEALRAHAPRYADEGKFYYMPLCINNDTRVVYVRVTAIRVSGDAVRCENKRLHIDAWLDVRRLREVIPLYTESEFLLLDQQDNVRGTRP